MSEKAPSNEVLKLGHNDKRNHERHHARAERQLTPQEKQHGNTEHIERAARKVEQQALSQESAPHAAHESSSPRDRHPVMVTRHMKNMSFSRAMVRMRKKLAAPDKALSAVIHAPVIEQVSEFAAKTVARPSGMFFGSLFALIGSSVFLWVSRTYGFEYNYLTFAVTFIVGMALGLALEALYKAMRLSR